MEYCTYITIYSGILFPRFYIGHSTVDKITCGYKGSVQSKKYKVLWKNELREHPELFDIIILSEHASRKEAIMEEYRLHKLKDIAKNPKFVNMTVANINGCFGFTGKGEDHHMFGKKLSCETINKRTATRRLNDNYTLSEESRKKLSLANTGHVVTKETRDKIRASQPKLNLGRSAEGRAKSVATRKANGSYVVSDAQKLKQSLSTKGRSSPMKGRKLSPEALANVTAANKKRFNYE